MDVKPITLTPLMQSTTKKSAWMIMWNGTTDRDIEILRRPRIVAILDYRLSESTIRKYLKLLYYSDQNLSPSWKHDEMHLHSIRRLKNPRWKSVEGSAGLLHFGSYSPWLEAKRVSGLFVDIYRDDVETTYWIESSPDGEPLNFKLETIYSNSILAEKLFCGEDAVPPMR